MSMILFNENYQSFLLQCVERIVFHTTILPQMISLMSTNKATGCNTPYLISFFKKTQNIPKFSSTTRTAHARVATNEKCFIREIRRLRSIGMQNNGLLTKKCFQLIIRQIKDEKTHHFFSCRSESSQLPSSRAFVTSAFRDAQIFGHVDSKFKTERNV